MSDVINDLNNQSNKKFMVFLHTNWLTFEKNILIIGVAGSLAWRDHHYEHLDMYQQGFATFELKVLKVGVLNQQWDPSWGYNSNDDLRCYRALTSCHNILILIKKGINYCWVWVVLFHYFQDGSQPKMR